MLHNNICNCRAIIYCPIKKHDIIIKHSEESHNISLEICKEEYYNRLWTIFNRETCYKRCVVNENDFNKTLWTTVYLEKNYINNKHIVINDIYDLVTDNSAEIYNAWVKWYLEDSHKFYDLTIRSYPQLGTIFIT